MANLFEHLPADASKEVFEKLVAGQDIRIERIVSVGHCSPPGFWYEQSENEFVLLLQGTAVIAFQDRPDVKMASGSWLEIPALRKHRVTETSVEPKAIWLAIFWPAKPKPVK